MKLQGFTLQIFEPERTLAFYIDVLGFKLKNEFSENNSTCYNLCFESTDYHIQLKYTPALDRIAYRQTSLDNYWKYSLFVDDIQRVYEELQKQNHTVGEPYQFGDIGYLSHTADTENHQIEFIQKTFKQNTPNVTATGSPGKEPTVLGLLTIRTKDPVKSIKFFEDLLGLKLFVRMYVPRERGFTLYFLGDKNLKAPNPNIDAIENREWMYQQSHLFIEIQHYWNSEYDNHFVLNASSSNGLQSMNFTGDIDVLMERLTADNIPFNRENDKVIFETIDAHRVSFAAT